MNVEFKYDAKFQHVKYINSGIACIKRIEEQISEIGKLTVFIKDIPIINSIPKSQNLIIRKIDGSFEFTINIYTFFQNNQALPISDEDFYIDLSNSTTLIINQLKEIFSFPKK